MKTCTGAEGVKISKKGIQPSHEHSLLLTACFVLVFSSFLLISSSMFAQIDPLADEPGFKAQVTATVINPYYKEHVPNFFEKMDPYQKLTFETSIALVFVLTIALVLHYQHRDRREQKPALA